MNDPFKHKVAIVTGGGSGIGRAVSEALAARGTCVVVADIDPLRAEETASALQKSEGGAEAVRLDVTDAAAVDRVVQDVVGRHGALDYMFNNAGIAIVGDMRDITLAHWNRILDVNLNGVIHGVMAAYPHMVRQGSGHIVNTASMAGIVPTGDKVLYTTSKFAVVGLSTSFRAEGRKHGVKVSVACPGYVDTNIYESAEVVNCRRSDFGQVRQMLSRFMESSQSCASEILRGVERNDAIILATRHGRVFFYLQRFFPGLVERLSNRSYEELLKHRLPS